MKKLCVRTHSFINELIGQGIWAIQAVGRQTTEQLSSRRGNPLSQGCYLH